VSVIPAATFPVSDHRWRLSARDENTLFAGEGLFHAAIEEISDVRVFFSLGAAQILVLNIGENLRENMLEFFRPITYFSHGQFLSY